MPYALCKGRIYHVITWMVLLMALSSAIKIQFKAPKAFLALTVF